MTDTELQSAFSNILQAITDTRISLKDEFSQELANTKVSLKDEISQELTQKLADTKASLKDEISQEFTQKLADTRASLKDEFSRGLADTKTSLKSDITKIQFTLENNIVPRLENIESCYVSTYQRYANGINQLAAMQSDIHVMKTVIMEHSEQLSKIS